MQCLQLIRTMRGVMTANEKKLADFILNDTHLLRDYSSQQLAHALGISQSSVVKFSQKLGFRGYPDLKLAVYESYALEQTLDLNNSTQGGAGTGSDDLLARKINAMSDAQANINPVAVDDLVSALERADKVVLFSLGVGDWVAGSLHLQLLTMGKTSLHEMLPSLQEVQLNALGEGDLLLLLVDSDENRLMFSSANKARQKGAIVAVIGRAGQEHLASAADIFLGLSGGVKNDGVETILFQTAVQHVADMILDRCLSRLENNRKAD